MLLTLSNPLKLHSFWDDNWFFFVSCHWDEDVGLFESLQQDKIAFAAVVQFQNMRGNGMRVILVQILIQWPWTDCHNQTINWTTFLLLKKWYFDPNLYEEFRAHLFMYLIACKYANCNHNFSCNNQLMNIKAWKWQSFF